MKIALALITFLTMGISFIGDKDKVRPEAVAGQFYPGDKTSLHAMVKSCFSQASDVRPENDAVALIVPHAGYVSQGRWLPGHIHQFPQTKNMKEYS